MQKFFNIMTNKQDDSNRPASPPSTASNDNSSVSKPVTIPEENKIYPQKRISAASINLIIIEATKSYAPEWVKLFKGLKIHGKPVNVEITEWSLVNLASYSTYGPNRETACFLDIRIPQENRVKTVRADFLLVRSQTRGVGIKQDYRNLLFGLKFAGVPSVNSLSSIYNFLERPWVMGELMEIARKLGHENFPIIDQNYYPNHQEMIIGPQFPAVVKVGAAHAGYGKMIINDHHTFADFASVMALSQDYVTAEPFLQGEYDLRIQKIGNHYRVFKRMSVSGTWKTNTGTSMMEEIELTDKYKLWADEASKMFGGLDILAVDAIHTTDGKEYILEVNDTSIGLATGNEKNDLVDIRDLVVEKMQQTFYAEETSS